MRNLKTLRDVWGKPFTIRSAYRCEEHNEREGGLPTSQHRNGLAFDINIGFGQIKDTDFIKLAYMCGFRGFGFHSDFIHLDCRPESDHPGAFKFRCWNGGTAYTPADYGPLIMEGYNAVHRDNTYHRPALTLLDLASADAYHVIESDFYRDM